LLVAGLVVLYMKWQPFQDKVNESFHNAVAGLQEMWSWIQRLWAWFDSHILNLKIGVDVPGAGTAGKIWGWISGGVEAIPNIGPVIRAGETATRATGGMAGGWTTVGEFGPELVRLPSGSQVKTAGATRISAGSYGGEVVVPVQINLDGRVLAEVVASHNLGEVART
jgi:hypothetical protein